MSDKRWRRLYKNYVSNNGTISVSVFEYKYWWWDEDVNWLLGPDEHCPFRILLFGCGDRMCGRRR